MILTGLGRLGGDVEIRHLQDGTAVGNLSLAFNYGKKSDDGKRPTQWVSASLWGERAEKLQEWLTKGTLLNVVLDDVHVETYEKRDGGTGTTLKARINSLEFAGGKRDDGEQNRPAQEKPPAKPRDSEGKRDGGFGTMDQDIPFNSIGRGISGHAI